MIRLPDSLAAWGTAGFDPTLKAELRQLPARLLPLQQGLRHGSHAIEALDDVVILTRHATREQLQIRAGLFYQSLIAGCNCADDPTPQDTLNEYCEIDIDIDRQTGEVRIGLVREE